MAGGLRLICVVYPRLTDHARPAVKRAVVIHVPRKEGDKLIRIGAYRDGADPIVDRAIALNPALEAFLGQDKDDVTRLADAFARLEQILNQGMIKEPDA